MGQKNSIEIKKLFDRIQKGDLGAFETVYDTYSASLYGIIFRIIKSEEVAEEILQDAFVKIWKNIQSYDLKKGTPFTWMLNIARNTAIDRLRQLKNQMSSEVKTPDFTDDILNDHKTTIRVNEIGVKDLLQKLQPELRETLEYVYFNGYTQKEAAEELNLPLGTIKSRVRIAVRELRKLFT